MEFISAGELEKYAYCPLSWWLARKGIAGKGKELKEGIDEHKELERGLSVIKEEEEKLFTSEFMIAILATSASILSIVGVGIYISQMVVASIIAMVIAAIWLVASAFFLFVALKSAKLLMSSREVAAIPSGTIEYIADEYSPNLVSNKHKLIGKPDYVIRINDGYVPVEFKAGRVPRGPLFSHIIQLVAYSLITEERYGKVAYGMLVYGKNQYKISISDELRETALKKANGMREALRTGIVHRDHKKVSKCRNCSRRSYCSEKLV
ncbi:MAG: CRISPR-associated protein Cas4 [Candidatus Thermoplasmatota archaeon]|nr:CRISPR-associated protein Cas4 [Candidatus Thermoplasmatota archaeon]MDI6887492.1 CRISPR-associated protein Cas4 [Candidatus Thermoplasmatota archaeon]